MATHDEVSKRGNTEGRAACSSTHGKFQRPFRRGTVTRGCIELSFAMSIEKFHASVTCRTTQFSPLLGTRNSHSDFPRGITLSLYFIRRRKVELSFCALWSRRDSPAQCLEESLLPPFRTSFSFRSKKFCVSRHRWNEREFPSTISLLSVYILRTRHYVTTGSFEYKYFRFRKKKREND